jgi:hypothetical protein
MKIVIILGISCVMCFLNNSVTKWSSGLFCLFFNSSKDTLEREREREICVCSIPLVNGIYPHYLYYVRCMISIHQLPRHCQALLCNNTYTFFPVRVSSMSLFFYFICMCGRGTDREREIDILV